MVVLQIVVILVCLWEEVSTGSFYSAILHSSPLTVIPLNTLKDLKVVQRAPGMLLSNNATEFCKGGLYEFYKIYFKKPLRTSVFKLVFQSSKDSW